MADAIREEEVESRWEAAPAVVVVIVFQLLLAFVSQSQDWKLWGLPWWVWLIPIVPEVILLIALAWQRPRRRLEQLGQRRNVALALLALISIANSLLLLAVLASLIRGDEKSGAQLLLKAMTVWGTNVITYGLWFWAFDRGGPVRRVEADPPSPDFQFPQMENPQLGRARLVPAAPRLRLRLVHELDRVQPDRRNAAHASREDADALRVGGLVGHGLARRRARGQHLHLEHVAAR